jgi:hypothetical protein
MVEEKRDEGAKDPTKLFLTKSICVIEERDVGEIFPNPSTINDNREHVFIKKSLWK